MNANIKANIHRPIKVQIVSRHFPLGNSGSCVYLMDFLRYLQQAGFEIECIILHSSIVSKGLLIIPSEVEKITFVAIDSLRVGRVLLRSRSWVEWIKTSPWLVYDLLPNNKLKNIYRFVKKRLHQVYGHVPTSKKVQLNVPPSSSKAALSKLKVETDALPTPEEISFAKAQFARFKPDVVIANYTCLGGVLDALSANEAILKVILTCDIQHQRFTSFQQVGVDSDGLNWDWEKESVELRKAQVLLAIQSEDAKVLKEMAPQCKVICTPMSASCHSHTVRQVPGRCLFVGSSALHNVHGLQWFLNSVWPIVLQSIPDCSLHICGSVCDQIQGRFSNAHFLDRVDDLKPEYSAAEVCVIPLLIGSGLKIKLVEALSYARACVSTSVGVQGLNEIAGSAVLVADPALDFAYSVCAILTDPGKRRWMEEQACRYVTDRLSPEAAYQPFVEQIYQHLHQTASR